MQNLKSKARILVVDDDASYRMALGLLLQNDYTVKTAANSDEALSLLKQAHHDLVILDMNMRHADEGLEAIPKFLETDPDLAIVVASGRTDFKTVQKAIRLGAADYLSKESGPDELKLIVQKTLEKRQLLKGQSQYRKETQKQCAEIKLLGKSKGMTSLRNFIEKARLNPSANVLIYGETGVGKEVVARMLRRVSEEGTPEPFLTIDSSTIHSTTAESILFGHEKGAFTGADQTKKGLFEEANGGIVYFDEIANMPLDIQNKLLRVVQEKEVKRLGSNKAIPLDFRVVAASNQNLDQLVREGKFKEDLLQRLNVIPLQIPPLRERVEDLEILKDHFCDKHRLGERLLTFSPEAWEAMRSYSWPGNVRELQNTIIFLYTMTDSETVELSDLPPKLIQSIPASKTSTDGQLSLNDRIEEFEENLLRQALAKNSNMSDLAVQLKISRSNLYAKIKRYGLDVTEQS